MKYALYSTGKGFKRKKVACQYEWPEDCFAQAGDMRPSIARLVASGQAHLADGIAPFFFEAFPTIPDTYVRGNGPTLAAAETDW